MVKQSILKRVIQFSSVQLCNEYYFIRVLVASEFYIINIQMVGKALQRFNEIIYHRFLSFDFAKLLLLQIIFLIWHLT